MSGTGGHFQGITCELRHLCREHLDVFLVIFLVRVQQAQKPQFVNALVMLMLSGIWVSRTSGFKVSVDLGTKSERTKIEQSQSLANSHCKHQITRIPATGQSEFPA